VDGPDLPFLGLSVGVIQHDLDDRERQVAYRCDVTYGTNNEFGFDFLRDNMKYRIEDMVQRGHPFGIVDESTRSSLTRRARRSSSPGRPTRAPRSTSTSTRHSPAQARRPLPDRRESTAPPPFTEEGSERIEAILKVENLYDPVHMDLVTSSTNALKAHTLFKRDVDYVVKDGEVIIVDESPAGSCPAGAGRTGSTRRSRPRSGSRSSARPRPTPPSRFQNYFRMYKKLAGMTGTAETEVCRVPQDLQARRHRRATNRKLVRIENPDIVYRTEKEKFNAIVRELTKLYVRGQPVLVGTISIEKSERLSELLDKIPGLLCSPPALHGRGAARRRHGAPRQEKELDNLLDADRCRHIVEKPARLKELLKELGREPGSEAVRFMDLLDGGASARRAQCQAPREGS